MSEEKTISVSCDAAHDPMEASPAKTIERQLVEIIAKAIGITIGGGWIDPLPWSRYVNEAASVLRALDDAGMAIVPKEPPRELLISMAIRDDHGLGCPGYYDQRMFAGKGVSHAQRLESAITTMSQIYEEVVGCGFYSPDNAERYAAIAKAESR